MDGFLDIREKQHEFTKEELYDLYVTKDMSRSKIAMKYKMKDSTVMNYLAKFGIKKGNNKIKKQEKQVLSKVVKELKFNIPKEELYELYIKKGFSIANIAKQYSVSASTVHKRIREHGIYKDNKKSLQTYNFDDLKKHLETIFSKNMTLENINGLPKYKINNRFTFEYNPNSRVVIFDETGEIPPYEIKTLILCSEVIYNKRRIAQYTNDGEFVRMWNSDAELKRYTFRNPVLLDCVEDIATCRKRNNGYFAITYTIDVPNKINRQG